MANWWTTLKSGVSETATLEKRLRHIVKHGIRNLGLTRSSGVGQRMWKELYKSNKGADKADLRVAIMDANKAFALHMAETLIDDVEAEETETPQQDNTPELLKSLQEMLATDGLTAASKTAINKRIVECLS